jgi:hypothetical protein
MKLGAQVINAVQRRTHASFGHNAVALAARGTDVAGEDRACRGYAVSQRRKRIEEPFGWGKTIGELARPMLRGVEKLGFKFALTIAGYNLTAYQNSSQPKHERQPHIGNSRNP